MKNIFQDIQEKPIFIIGQGPSAYELQENIHKFKNKDILWASLNRFQLIEDEILSLIDKKLDIVYCASNQRYKEERKSIQVFKNKEESLFITNSSSYVCFDDFHNNCHIYISDFGYGFSSIFAMLCALGKLQAKNIYLFGFDGGPIPVGNDVYFCQKKIDDNFEAREKSILKDTIMMNKIFVDYLEYIGVKDMKIINVNPYSIITCFEKYTMEQTLR